MGGRQRGIKNSINRFSALVSVSLEKSMETADSMRSRGFGRKKRKPYIRYGFALCDAVLLAVLAVLFAAAAVSGVQGVNVFLYEPVMKFANSSIVFYVLFGLLSFVPVLVDLAGEMKWHLLRLKI